VSHTRIVSLARFRFGSAVCALAFSLCGLLPAQVSTTGKITGVVTDATGAALAAATVKVEGNALMAPRSTQTQPDGSYLFDLLPPGSYELTVTSSGFQTLRQTGIVITAGFTATISPHLQVGQVQQSVTVSGEGVVDVQSVQAETTFDQQLLQEIPAGRDPWSTVAQMPGVTLTTFDVGGNQSMQQSTMQVHGSTPGEQIFSFNGLDLNWPGANGGYTQFYTDHDSFEHGDKIRVQHPARPGGGLLCHCGHSGQSGASHLQWLAGKLRFADLSRPRYDCRPGGPDQARQVVAVWLLPPLRHRREHPDGARPGWKSCPGY